MTRVRGHSNSIRPTSSVIRHDAVHAQFNSLASAYFESSYRASPTSATDLGIHEYDHLLDDMSQSAISARIQELRSFQRKFSSLERRRMEEGIATDLALVCNDIEMELWFLDDTRDWETDPSYYVSDPFFSIFLLASRDFAPVGERMQNLTARLSHVPDLLSAARANLKNPAHILTEIGIEETEGAIEFCESLIPQVTQEFKPTTALKRAVASARTALESFLLYLRDELMLTSTGKIGIGKKQYAKILSHDHMLPYTIDEVVALGERVFAETERELALWAKRIDKSKTWRDIAAQARAEYPPRHRLLSSYRREVRRLRDFVRGHDLVTLPEQDCEVVETPPFDRALNSFAAYIAPGPFDDDQRGQFWVTPIDPSAPRAQQIEQLEAHSNYLYPITAAHEAYPGHHVQLVRANHVGSRWRKHFSSSIFAEGWALYCEELMNEAGYYSDPRMRLFQLQDRLWRAARVINEIGIHCFEVTMEDAARFLVDKVGLSHAAARAETRRYVAEPGQPMSYLIGELEVLRLRKKFRRLPLKKFHDLLLDSGTIPFVLVEQEMQAKMTNTWQKIMKDLSARILNMAQMRGATYCDVRVVNRTVQTITVKNGRVQELTQDESQGFGVRVIADGAWGFASSSRDEYTDVDATVNRALQIARAAALTKSRDVRLGPPEANKGTYRSEYKLDPFMISMSDKINLLLKADESMRRVKKNGAHLVTTSELVFVREEKIFASTEGALIQQESIESGCEIQALATDDSGDVQSRTYPWGRHQQTRGFEFVLAQQLVENAPRIAEEAIMLLSADACPASDNATVILSGNQVALQVHESCGHPIELDRVLKQEASFAGTSFLTLDKLNNLQYGSELVNITADATIPGGLGTFGYDDEGVPAQRADIIKQGRFVGYMTNRELAADYNLGRSNGTMRAESWNRTPLIRMTNVNLLPGTWKLNELIADTDDGILFDTNRSWSIDDKRLNFQFGTELAWEIKNGKKVRLLKNPIYTGITPNFWRSCDAICDESHWVVWGTPRCGKGQPPQTIRTGHGASPARFRNVKVFSRS